MMRLITCTLLLVLLWTIGYSQDQKRIDSLKRELAIAKHDTSRFHILFGLASEYDDANGDPDSARMYGQEALDLARQIKFLKGEAQAYKSLGTVYRRQGDFPTALKFLFKALQIANDNQYQYEAGSCQNAIAIVYSQLNDNPSAIIYQKQAIKSYESIHNTSLANNSEINLGRGYRRNNQLDSAAIYFQKAYKKLDSFKFTRRHSFLSMEMGTLQFQLGNRDKAFEYLQESIQLNKKNKDHFYGTFAYNVVADFFREMNQADSCIFYAKKALGEAQLIGYKYGILDASTLLAEQLESKDLKEAHFYLKLRTRINDELYGSQKVQELQKITLEEQERHREAEAERIANENRFKQYVLLAGLAVMFLVGFILYRNNRQKQKANLLLQQQKEEVDMQRGKAEKALDDLKATQAQLIQSEKMASLGELTAGIAHEIQNPLNFVNNFSEINKELMEELNEEVEKGNCEEVKAITKDVIDNEAKITHHGKRAEAIVKSMLQHSRTGSGEKELTDINALADEYLRLAYHGLRAKDQSFNAEFKTELDESLPKIEVVPQDIGRVLLNLINNAFQAVEDIENPSVTVSTKQENGKVEISVKDNGRGIPDDIKDKIFQPFFTTKPTGEGTGLGLSMSYDIVTKGHGGTLEMQSKIREGTAFILTIPM